LSREDGERVCYTVVQPAGLWERHVMALDAVTERLQRIVTALEEANVPYALGGRPGGGALGGDKRPRLAARLDALLSEAGR
jgi:hypothetical protein